jgi:hypothetical protein
MLLLWLGRVINSDIYYCMVVAFHNRDVVVILTHCGRVTQICVFNAVKLGTSASSP